MDKKIMKKWVKALRSGKYRKGTQQLCSVANNGNKSWCCLGVLTDLYNKEHKHDPIELDDHDVCLPDAVMCWSGIRTWFGQLIYNNRHTDLSELNDCTYSKRSFKRMADIIEKNWEQL